jgi:hypothetical protein
MASSGVQCSTTNQQEAGKLLGTRVHTCLLRMCGLKLDACTCKDTAMSIHHHMSSSNQSTPPRIVCVFTPPSSCNSWRTINTVGTVHELLSRDGVTTLVLNGVHGFGLVHDHRPIQTRRVLQTWSSSALTIQAYSTLHYCTVQYCTCMHTYLHVHN